MQLSHTQTFVQRQSMVVNAQLQQAIELLHMGNSELASFIEAQAEENPFLDLARPKSAPAPIPTSARRSTDDEWDPIAALADPGERSLYAHASAEIARLGLTDAEARLSEDFLDALEPSGWLSLAPEAIAMQAGVTEAAALALLAKLQTIEPAGIFARNLAECLRLQAADRGILTPLFGAVLDNLPLLAAADLKGLARACHSAMDDLRDVLKQLRGLDPKPGAAFDGGTEPQRAPDLIVTRGAAGWQVELNRSTLPAVEVRAQKAEALAQATPGGRKIESGYVTERLSLARWLARAVEHRNMTTLKVGAEILRRQADFLDHGPGRLRPMVLRDVADEIGVHESTVSRVTTGILMQTPHGTFPLKWFFTAALARSDSDEAGSAAAVRHRLTQLIAAEDPAAPLSDDALVKIIEAEGTQLARRTVAKYREQLKIASSTQRRRQALVTGRA